MDSNKVKLKVYTITPVFQDRRGDIFDILESPVAHVGMVTFKKGGIERGNHYHKKSIQYTYVLKGKIKLTTTDIEGKNKREFMLKPGSFAVIPPKIVHIYTSITSATMLDFTTESRKGGGYEKDTFRVGGKI